MDQPAAPPSSLVLSVPDKLMVLAALTWTRSTTMKYVVLAASVGHSVPVVGALKACRPEAVKLPGSLSVHSTAPGAPPVATSLSVTRRSAPAVDVSEMLRKSMPTESTVYPVPFLPVVPVVKAWANLGKPAVSW